jgi:hypothetical protein
VLGNREVLFAACGRLPGRMQPALHARLAHDVSPIARVIRPMLPEPLAVRRATENSAVVAQQVNAIFFRLWLREAGDRDRDGVLAHSASKHRVGT